MDVVLKSIAEVVESSRVYDDSGVDVVIRDDVTLSMIATERHENFYKVHVDVRCKVILVKESAAIGVNEGRMKQDIIVADCMEVHVG